MIRTEKYPIYFGKPFPQKLHARWLAMLDHCTEARNLIWRTWLVWHTQTGSERKIREWLIAVKAWHEHRKADQKAHAEPNRLAEGVPLIVEKPKCSVVCVPPELGRLMYAQIRKAMPQLHTRSLVLLQSAIVRDMTKHKASKGSLPGWMAILLNRQGAPSFLGRSVIPFDAKNSKLISREGKEDWWKLECRIELAAARKSIVDFVRLYVNWKRADILKKIVAGEFKFCGSSIMFDDRDRRWYALISYDTQRKFPEVDPDSDVVAVLSPGRKRPWRMRYAGRVWFFGGRGENVSERRRHLTLQRIARQANYRHSASSTKGHGTNRALAGYFRLQHWWKGFCHATDQQVASEIARFCARRGIASLFVVKPVGDYAWRRFLASAGRVDNYEKTSGWDWTRALARLNSRCEKDGIRLEIRRVGESKLRETTV